MVYSVLGGESNTPIPVYNVVHRPLGLPQLRSYYSVGCAGRSVRHVAIGESNQELAKRNLYIFANLAKSNK